MESELESHDEFLAKKAAAIRRLAKNVARDVVEIGGHLAEAKKKCPHGKWLSWLQEEFLWGDDTANRCMRAASFIKSRNLRNFENLGLSVIYLLGAPSTPEAARDKIISSFQAGAVIPFPSPSPEPPVVGHTIWELLNWLENAANYINSIESAPGLDEAVRALIEAGHWRDIAPVAESFARAGEIGKRLMAAAPKAEP